MKKKARRERMVVCSVREKKGRGSAPTSSQASTSDSELVASNQIEVLLARF